MPGDKKVISRFVQRVLTSTTDFGEFIRSSKHDIELNPVVALPETSIVFLRSDIP